MRLPRLGLIPTFLCVAAVLPAASLDDRVETLFRPLIADRIALSPDGERVAYTTQIGGELAIVMMTLEPPARRRTVKVQPDRDVASADMEPPTQLRFLRWATATRLVYAPAERVIPMPPLKDKRGRSMPNPDGPTIVAPIFATDADGKQHGALVDARHFMDTPADAYQTLADLLLTPMELAASRKEPTRWRMPHVDILGFFPGDREQLIIRTHGGYAKPAQHLVDIRTGSVRMFGDEWPAPPGEPLVFDWFRVKVVGERMEGIRPTTVWRDDELGRVQQALDLKFPRRAVEILDWSDTRTRVLFRVTGGTDPGRVFVFQRQEDLVLEILRRAPWLSAAKLNPTRFFEFAAADGARLSGYVTWPGKPRVTPPPLLVVFPSGFPGRAQPAFDPEAQVFADLGFVVARLNHRSIMGIRKEDINALRTAADRVSVDDAQATIAWIAARNPARPFDPQRIATLGRGFGGYLAVRALQLEPAVFRCGIAIDAPMELREWLAPPKIAGAAAGRTAAADVPVALTEHGLMDWKKLSVLDQAQSLTNPVLLMIEPGRSPAVDVSTEALRARLTGLGRTADHVALDPGFAAAQPASRAAAYRKIEEFLHRHAVGHTVTSESGAEVK